MSDEVRFFTPEQARDVIPRLKPILAALREAFHAYRFAKDQADELERIHGPDGIGSREHPEHAEWRRWTIERDTHASRVRTLLMEANALGADVKDPLMGLVDFYARRSDGETVLLCWRDDEATLAWWHPVATGFAGRRPLSEL